jgi:nitroimidazol reductase NimA-like FMN-containing flavoprotein (pyridoxamine 5'-phosphate oxidase superfamily)
MEEGQMELPSERETITEEMQRQLHELMATQTLAVLATQGGEQPYCSLIAFAASDDLKRLLFATARHTRKYANLADHSQVALLVDNRSGQEADFHEAMAATAVGQAEELPDDELPGARAIYLARHPHLVDFVGSPTCALLCVKVQTYYVVTRFQQVVEYHLER